MSERKGIAFEPVTGNTLITPRPCLLHGVVVLASSDGGRVTVYDGADAGSGRKIGTFKGWENLSNPIMFPRPLGLSKGLFIGDFSHIDEVLILWEPAPEHEK